jgi:hypothetical protein
MFRLRLTAAVFAKLPRSQIFFGCVYVTVTDLYRSKATGSPDLVPRLALCAEGAPIPPAALRSTRLNNWAVSYAAYRVRQQSPLPVAFLL